MKLFLFLIFFISSLIANDIRPNLFSWFSASELSFAGGGSLLSAPTSRSINLAETKIDKNFSTSYIFYPAGIQAQSASLLLSINNKVISLNDIKGEKATLIMFICNHCPYVKAIIKDLAKDCNELRNDGISSVAIMSNDTKNYPEDSFDNMIKFASSNNFDNINYLFINKCGQS